MVSENGPIPKLLKFVREQSFPLGKSINLGQNDIRRKEREGVRFKLIGKEIRLSHLYTCNLSRGKPLGIGPVAIREGLKSLLGLLVRIQTSPAAKKI